MSFESQGTIDLPEVSGAVLISDDRIVVVSDENGVAVVNDAAKALGKGELHATSVDAPEIDDLEDVTWDGHHVLAVASHGLNRRGEVKKKRRRMLRLGEDLQAPTVSSALQLAISGEASLVDSQRRPPAQSDLNIEGLAFTPNGLWVGLRSPTLTSAKERESKMQEDAILLCVDPKSLFAEAEAAARLTSMGESGPFLALDLEGNGVRGLAEHDGDLLILAGLSPDPNPNGIHAPWALWRYRPGGTPRKMTLKWPDWLTSPEGISVIRVEGKGAWVLLFQDAGEQMPSRYAASIL